MSLNYWGVLWSALASAAFAILFNLRRRDLAASAFGGALCWLSWLLVIEADGGSALAFFISSMVVALFAELAGRRLQRPPSIYLVPSLMPLVPGGGMYYMMQSSLSGDQAAALSIGFTTLFSAGAIAAGVAVVSAAMRLTYSGRRGRDR